MGVNIGGAGHIRHMGRHLGPRLVGQLGGKGPLAALLRAAGAIVLRHGHDLLTPGPTMVQLMAKD